MRAIVLLLALASLVPVTACREVTQPDPETDPETDGMAELRDVDPRLMRAYTGFGLKLFRQVAAEEGDANVFLSPTSVAFALAMTQEGAAAETRAAFDRVLETEGLSREEVSRSNAAWLAALQTPTRAVELAIANSLWGREGVPFRQEYLARVREAYGAEVTALDFSDPSASRTINEWVSRSTRGRIPQIVPESIDPRTILYLINAVYFKGSWSQPFDPERTREGTWHLPGGSTRQVPMMQRLGGYRVLDAEGVRGVALPYGNGDLGMYILLPAEGSTLAELRARLDPAEWARWMSGFRKAQVELRMPRYRLEYELGLVTALDALGLGVAFDPIRADFAEMLPRDFLERNNAYVSDVKHKTFVEVNELGTEAAGATSVEVGVTSMPASFVVDRPFLVAIRDNRNGTLLFLGQIVDPG